MMPEMKGDDKPIEDSTDRYPVNIWLSGKPEIHTAFIEVILAIIVPEKEVYQWKQIPLYMFVFKN